MSTLNCRYKGWKIGEFTHANISLLCSFQPNWLDRLKGYKSEDGFRQHLYIKGYIRMTDEELLLLAQREIDLITQIPKSQWPDSTTLTIQGPIDKEGLQDYGFTNLKSILLQEPEPEPPPKIRDPFTGALMTGSSVEPLKGKIFDSIEIRKIKDRFKIRLNFVSSGNTGDSHLEVSSKDQNRLMSILSDYLSKRVESAQVTEIGIEMQFSGERIVLEFSVADEC